MSRGDDDLVSALRELDRAGRPEPRWDELERSIRAACDEVDERRRRSLWARLRGWLAPDPAARRSNAWAIGTLAVCAALLVAAWVIEPGPTADRSAPLARAPREAVDLRAGDLEDLDEPELDALLDTLDREESADAGAEDTPTADSLRLAAPEYELWIDDLDDRALDDLADDLAG